MIDNISITIYLQFASHAWYSQNISVNDNHILIISDDDRLGNLEPDDLQSPMTPNDNGDVDWDALYGMFDLK